MALNSETAGPTGSTALASGIAYGILCVTAVEILTDSSTGSGTPKEATGGVLGWSGGTVLVAIAGAVLIGVAAYQAYKGLAKKFLDDAKTGEMSPGVRNGYTALGVFGHVARAVIFALVGYGLIKAAIDYNPKEAIGLDGALRKLAACLVWPCVAGRRRRRAGGVRALLDGRRPLPQGVTRRIPADMARLNPLPSPTNRSTGPTPCLVLGPILRSVEMDRATVWVEADAACEVTVRARGLEGSSQTFAIEGHHYALVELEGFAPGASHVYEVLLDGERVWPEPESEFPPRDRADLRPGRR